MRICAISSVWNNSLWAKHCLDQAYDLVDCWLIQSCNWTSDDPRWAGETSPDGTADIIRSYSDPKKKIQFYELGRWQHGCLAARAELCSRIPECDLVWVLDFDEFYPETFLRFLDQNWKKLKKQGYKTISQNVRSFYWDFSRCTYERFTRFQRWYPGINCWQGAYFEPKDFDVAQELGPLTPSSTELGPEIFHYSYVPPPGVEIKGAESFDVPRERYKQWYRDTYSKFDGTNLDEVYKTNQGGVHVFGGTKLHEYIGPHPKVLDDHSLRHARWTGNGFLGNNGEEIALKGWWNL